MRFYHGLKHHELYPTWLAMMQRCEHPKNPRYRDYGGRGIRVDPSWRNVKSFIESILANIGAKPTPEHTLERIDNNGNYEPKNVKWATKKEQSNNSRHNHIIKFNGQRKTLQQWAETLKINHKTLRSRINTYRWPIEKAFVP